MKPNTPHLVLTPTASICHGGHFYPASNLRDIFSCVAHTFTAGSVTTNTEHTSSSRELLQRILYFFLKSFLSNYIIDGPTGKTMSPQYRGNIPDIFSFQGLLDVLSLCNLMELGNVMHYMTYTEKGMDVQQRWRMIAGRVVSRKVKSWLGTVIEIHHPENVPSMKSLEDDVIYPYLCSQVAALLHYKKHALVSGAQSHVPIYTEDLATQINRTFAEDRKFQSCYDATIDPKTFDWVGPEYQVKPVGSSMKQVVLTQDGRTPDDMEWLKVRQGLVIVQQDRDDSRGEKSRKRKRLE